MEFFRQEYWSGLPFPSPGDLPHPRIKPQSPALQADALPSEPLDLSQEPYEQYENQGNMCSILNNIFNTISSNNDLTITV